MIILLLCVFLCDTHGNAWAWHWMHGVLISNLCPSTTVISTSQHSAPINEYSHVLGVFLSSHNSLRHAPHSCLFIAWPWVRCLQMQITYYTEGQNHIGSPGTTSLTHIYVIQCTVTDFLTSWYKMDHLSDHQFPYCLFEYTIEGGLFSTVGNAKCRPYELKWFDSFSVSYIIIAEQPMTVTKPPWWLQWCWDPGFMTETDTDC